MSESVERRSPDVGPVAGEAGAHFLTAWPGPGTEKRLADSRTLSSQFEMFLQPHSGSTASALTTMCSLFRKASNFELFLYNVSPRQGGRLSTDASSTELRAQMSAFLQDCPPCPSGGRPATSLCSRSCATKPCRMRGRLVASMSLSPRKSQASTRCSSDLRKRRAFRNQR